MEPPQPKRAPDPPGFLRQLLDLYAPRTEAPPEAILATGISLVSTAIGWKASLRWADSEEPVCISILLAGESATTKKTTLANTAENLIHEAFQNAEEQDKRLRVRQVSHTSGRGLLELVSPKSEDEAVRWITEQSPGVLIVWDEFGAVLGKPGEAKGGDWMGQVRTTIMQVVNGRNPGIQTGTDKRPSSRCAVAILGTLTRVELEERVRAGLIRDGFLGRFALIPHNGRERYLALPPEWTTDELEQKAHLATWIRHLAQSREIIGDVFTKMTPDAKAARVQWYEATAKLLEAREKASHSDKDVALVEAFGRVQSTAIKIAVVAAVCEWAPPTSLAQLVIDERHIRYGQWYAKLLLDELGRIIDAGSSSVEDDYLERVLHHLETRGPQTRRDLLEHVRIKGISKNQAWAIIAKAHPDLVYIEPQGNTGGRHRLIVSLP